MSDPMQNLNNAADALNQVAQRAGGFWDDADARISAKEAQVNAALTSVDDYLAINNPEKRIETDIHIGGSPDWLYPVLFRAPNLNSGPTHMSIYRQYAWNSGTRPLNPSSSAQAGLLLDFDIWDALHGGDGGKMRVRHYRTTYNLTASHLRWAGYGWQTTNDGLPPAYDYRLPGYDDANPSTWVCRMPRWSSVYLRGGGVSYRFRSTNPLAMLRLDDEDLPPQTNVLVVHDLAQTQIWLPASNTEFIVKPIPLADIEEPIENLTWS